MITMNGVNTVMMFADVGCFYFVIDAKGKVTWTWDSY